MNRFSADAMVFYHNPISDDWIDTEYHHISGDTNNKKYYVGRLSNPSDDYPAQSRRTAR